jgi:hypothetical protein
MTATVSSIETTTTSPAEQAAKNQPVWKQGLVAGLAAAAATTAVVAVAQAIDVPVEVAGEAIPLLGFAQMTLLCTLIGIGLARVIGRRAAHPRSLFTNVTVVLTALSFLPDVTADATTATKVTLMLTHVVAAAIVIPVLAGRLAERRTS